ncbi:MAG: hypothetical protein IJV71_11910 [Lachnospiraceae bacterium]|nr:hypothetical protein [Lachnospiraceae bacterium]
MRKRLVIDYQGTDTLTITLVESAIKEIHESAGGKLLGLQSEELREIEDIDIIQPLTNKLVKDGFIIIPQGQ